MARVGRFRLDHVLPLKLLGLSPPAKLLPFIEHQLMDCDMVDSGCDDELMDTAFASTEKKTP